MPALLPDFPFLSRTNLALPDPISQHAGTELWRILPHRPREQQTPPGIPIYPFSHPSAALQRDTLLCSFTEPPSVWHPGDFQCFRGVLPSPVPKGVRAPLDWGVLGTPTVSQESCGCFGAVGPCYVVWGRLTDVYGSPCFLEDADAAAAPSPWRPSQEVHSWAGAS